MDVALIAGAGLMGLAGAPHCTAMCGAPCGALARRCGGAAPNAALAGFLGGRLLGYMAGGAAVAAGVAALAALGDIAPALRPVWTALHAAALGLGIWLLVSGRMPAWLGATATATASLSAPARADAAGWQRMSGPLRAGGAGTLWLALPCGLLQAALIVAALASTPWQGAAAMGAFAAASSLGLVVYPALWSRWPASLGTGVWVVRASGAMLLATSAWALGHGLWERVVAFCGGA